jgi:hypothetical protein
VLEPLVEVQGTRQPRGQYLVQGDPADRVVRLGRRRDWTGVVAQHGERLHALGEEAETVARRARSGEEGPPQRRWQALVQCPRARRVDVDPIALQPLVAGVGTLVHRDVYSSGAQPVRQAQSTGATADHDHTKRHEPHLSGRQPHYHPFG